MTANHPIRILHLEDSADDAELIQGALRAAGLVFVAQRVETRNAFECALREFQPDVVLVDCVLPGFDGRSALRLARQELPDVPVILVTGALVEDVIVKLLEDGARDYILKDRLARLAPAIRCALRAAQSAGLAPATDRQDHPMTKAADTQPGIRILLLEDSLADADLVRSELRRAGLHFVLERVDTRAAYLLALRGFRPDVILADWVIPGFDGRTALRLARIALPDVPVIIVTGALADDVIASLLEEGARNYVFKDRLARLGPAVHSAAMEFREAAIRASHRFAGSPP